MVKSEIYDIVNTEYLKISISQINHFTLGTSPYYAHQNGLAIDIYQDLFLENYDVLSPISGKIIKIKELIAPKAKFAGGIDKEYLILVSNPLNSNLVYKILHVKPKVQVGDKIEIGDYLGKTIRNGYFAYWSSPHLHLEIRSSNDAIRASGGKMFSLAIENNNKLRQSRKDENLKQIPLKIESSFPEFLLASLPSNFYYGFEPIHGVKVQIEHSNFILDGGIPHYKTGTVLFHQKCKPNSLHSVYFGNYKIGTLSELRDQLGFFNFDSVKFLLNDKEIRGLSLFLAKSLPLIKLIPYKKNEFSFKLNSTQYLTIIVEKNTK